MLCSHGKVRRAAGELTRLLGVVAECPTCDAVATCHAEALAASVARLRDVLRGPSPTELRRAAASLLWYLREVQSCCVCAPEEGCHKEAVDKAAETLRMELHPPRKGGAL